MKDVNTKFIELIKVISSLYNSQTAAESLAQRGCNIHYFYMNSAQGITSLSVSVCGNSVPISSTQRTGELTNQTFITSPEHS